MKSSAVIKVALGARKAEFMRLAQGHDEEFWTFAVQVQGKAKICNFTTVCECTAYADYMENAIKDVMLAGITDINTCRETLSTENNLAELEQDHPFC